MQDLQMGDSETRFAEIIWQNEPISTVELVKRSGELLLWKKTTAYTVLRRLCEKGIFENRGGLVVSRISRQDFYAMQSEKFVAETFDGSLPAFLAAFTARKSLTTEEIALLRGILDAQESKGEA